MLVHQIADVPEIHFSEVDSAFNEDGSRVDVTAIVTSQKRRELLLEAIVAKLNEISGVTRASWRLNRQSD